MKRSVMEIRGTAIVSVDATQYGRTHTKEVDNACHNTRGIKPQPSSVVGADTRHSSLYVLEKPIQSVQRVEVYYIAQVSSFRSWSGRKAPIISGSRGEIMK